MFWKKLRFSYWMVTAYVRKHVWFLVSSFVITIGCVSAYLFFANIILSSLANPVVTIGITGAANTSTLPPEVVSKVTTSLLYQNPDGSYASKIIDSWSHNDEFTRYTLVLKPRLFYSDKTPFTSSTVPFNLKDVKLDTSDPMKLVFILDKPFAHFYDYLTKPLIAHYPIRAIGGEYVVTSARKKRTNDTWNEIELVPVEHGKPNLHYRVYKNESDLITAFKLHEIDEFVTSNESAYKNFSAWPNTTTTKDSVYSQVVALFFNTSNPLLKDRDLREAMYGSIPSEELLKLGNLAVSPLSPYSTFYDKTLTHIPENPDVYGAILKRYFKEASSEATFTINTSVDFLPVANAVKDIIKGAGGEATLDLTGLARGGKFKLLIGLWNIPSEPNQYYVWHSSQKGKGNISEYESQKVDKLLEDFRATSEAALQKKYMVDFQKRFARDLPAAMLYYPYRYTISRKR
ncbi:MAG: ABC transporter substrate-binding protein [bacterium]